MTQLRAPRGLGVKGKALWSTVTGEHALGPVEKVILEEACRTADRLDGLDEIIQGKGVLKLLHMRMPGLVDDQGTATVNLTVDGVLSEARQQANVMKQLLVSLRLPDEKSGSKPQQRGARGAYRPPAGATGKVTALDAARKRAQGGRG